MHILHIKSKTLQKMHEHLIFANLFKDHQTIN
jgi:hypothetical protein